MTSSTPAPTDPCLRPGAPGQCNGQCQYWSGIPDEYLDVLRAYGDPGSVWGAENIRVLRVVAPKEAHPALRRLGFSPTPSGDAWAVRLVNGVSTPFENKAQIPVQVSVPTSEGTKRTSPKNPAPKYVKPLCPKCSDLGYVRQWAEGYVVTRCRRCKAGKEWDGKTI